ncbi:MAG TPA: hypothetical protein VMQ76_10695 [Terracidiphilus sp.]|jgi:hypothetical protein|nr:hypothetical protein [Terracidiphilus sp.]
MNEKPKIDGGENPLFQAVHEFGRKMDSTAPGAASGLPVGGVGAGPDQASGQAGGSFPGAVPGAGDNAPVLRAVVEMLDRFGVGYVKRMARRAGLDDADEIAAECAMSEQDRECLVQPAVLVLAKYRLNVANLPEVALLFGVVAIGGRYRIAVGEIKEGLLKKANESQPQAVPTVNHGA